MNQNENENPQTTVPSETTAEPKPKRGFALMTSERVRELARRGGQMAHQAGTAYRWNSESAREAGKKGAVAARKK